VIATSKSGTNTVFLVRRDRCDTCPLDSLDRQISRHPSLTRSYDLDFALSSGIRITLDEVTVEEFRVLKCLKIEKSKFEVEQMKRARNQR
jgi:hypothetical protein